MDRLKKKKKTSRRRKTQNINEGYRDFNDIMVKK